MMRSMGGVTQIIPGNRVASRRRMPQSLMMSAAQLGLSARDVADLVAFLRREVTIVAMPMVGRASTGAHPHGTRPVALSSTGSGARPLQPSSSTTTSRRCYLADC